VLKLLYLLDHYYNNVDNYNDDNQAYEAVAHVKLGFNIKVKL
jgi:hypothetical protein